MTRIISIIILMSIVLSFGGYSYAFSRIDRIKCRGFVVVISSNWQYLDEVKICNRLKTVFKRVRKDGVSEDRINDLLIKYQKGHPFKNYKIERVNFNKKK